MYQKSIFITVTNDISYDQRMQKTASTLSDLGHQVTIIGRSKKNTSYLNTEKYNTYRLNLFFQSGKLFYIEYQIRLFFYLLTHSFDTICSVDLDTILPGLLCAKLKQKKIIYDAHEYYTEVPELTDRPIERTIWKCIEAFCVPKCDKMYTVSNPIATLFKSKYAISCDVIYNFPLTIQSIEKPIKDTPIILYQGDINMGRGLDEAIVAMRDVHAHLYIAGDGYYRKELEKIVQLNQLEEKVFFLGYLLPDQLRSMTLKATIGINLLENKGLNYYYSLANKFFDYVQQEIPSINMNFPCYWEFNLQFQCSLLLDTLDPVMISKAMNELLEHEDTYHALVSNCNKAKKEWNWEKQTPLLKAIYES